MLIHKIFHAHLSVEETRRHLAKIGSYRHQFTGVNALHLSAEGLARFEFKIAPGVMVSADLAEVPDSSPEQLLFRSIGGNVDVAGVLDFCAVKPNLTEVALTMEFQLKSPLHQMLNALTSGMERFLNEQLERVEMALDGIYVAPVMMEEKRGRDSHGHGAFAQAPSPA